MTQPLMYDRPSRPGFWMGRVGLLAAGLVLASLGAHAVVPIQMLKDIVPGTDSSDPKEFCVFNNQLYFQATDASHGAELWVSDTTEAGTVLFANAAPDSPNPQGSFPENLKVYNNKLYFSAYDGSTGRDLWVTTGTAGNLTRFGLNLGHDANPKFLTVANGYLFFAAKNDSTGVELYRTDGSSTLPTDINPGAGSSYPADFVVLGTKLYFTADDGTHGREIWMTNGTATTLLADIRAGSASSSPSSLTVFGNKLYFAADDGVNGSQLWVSTGTAGNAQMVATLTEPGDFALPSQLTPAGSILFLASRGDSAGVPVGMELWQTNGTAGAFSLVGDLLPGAEGSNPSFLTAYNNSVVFSAAGVGYDNEPWISNGTAAGTVRLKDIYSGTTGSQPGPFFPYQGNLYFAAGSSAEGRELWRTDGTPAGTLLIKNINPDGATANGSFPEGFVEVRNRLVFAATTAANGREPWIIDYDTFPVITEGASVSVNMNTDGAPTPFSLTLHATDAEGDTLTWGISAPAAHGTATASGTGSSKVIGYTPALHYLGTDAFAVTVNDGHGGSAVCTVNVTIAAPITGSIVINGNRSATNNATVTLSLAWSGGAGTGVVRMRFSDDGATWTAWQSLAATIPHVLPSGDGHKTVRVQYLDSKNLRSPVFSDYIRLDTTPPTGSIVINDGASSTTTQAVTLKLTYADDGAGVTRMRFSDNGSTWTYWMLPSATKTYTLPAGLGYHTVRVQYLDGAGNYSAVYNDYIKLIAP